MAFFADELAFGTIDLCVSGERPLPIEHVVARRRVGQFIGIGVAFPEDEHLEVFPRNVRDMVGAYTPK
jgi:hypothetical protein